MQVNDDQVALLRQEISEIRDLCITNSKTLTYLAESIGSAATRTLLSVWQQRVIEACGFAFEKVLLGGSYGAVEIRSQSGESLVLKVFPIESENKVRRGVEVARQIRSQGVPVPQGLSAGTVAGVTFTLQQKCPGLPPRNLSFVQAQQIVENLEKQKEIYDASNGFGQRLIQALVEGDIDIWCDHLPIISFGGRPTKLLRELQSIGPQLSSDLFRSLDGVHWDASHRNALFESDQLTAVIDWEAAIQGDYRFDLENLYFWARVHRGNEVDEEACEYLDSCVLSKVDSDARVGLCALVCLHHLYFMTTNRPDLVDSYIDNVERYLAPAWR